MAQVIVDVPLDKMQSFAQAIVNLGIDSRFIISKHFKKTMQRKKRLSDALQKISSSFILFEWEYFSNELEYE